MVHGRAFFTHSGGERALNQPGLCVPGFPIPSERGSPATAVTARGYGSTTEESNVYHDNPSVLGMTDHGRFSRVKTLQAIQRGEVWVYMLITREGAIKVGSTRDLAVRTRGIKFGGTKKIMGFIPGDLDLERSIQYALAEHRIPGTREYFYPLKPVLAKANWMRAYWGIEPLPTHYLPRMSRLKFHRRVIDAEAHGTSVFDV